MIKKTIKYIFGVVIFVFLLSSCSEKKKLISEFNKNNKNIITIKEIDDSEVFATEEIIDSEIINGFKFSEDNYNYANGNGTIIEQVIENNIGITVRKHEDTMELFTVPSDDGWYRANDMDTLVLLEKPKLNSSVIYTLPEFPIITREFNFGNDNKKLVQFMKLFKLGQKIIEAM
jgi:hypothetical protein